MRIIINECKKILDIRIILLLCMFSILYYMTFTPVSYTHLTLPTT